MLLVTAAMPVYAAETNFFGPVIPTECHCEGTAPEFGCIIQVVQNLLNLLVSLGIIAVTFFIAWAGFLMITGGSNPATRKKAANRMLNAVV